MRSITLKNVKKSYKNQLILNDLNLEIPAGSFFTLLGPSGSGKTTILRMIAGFEVPDEGVILFGDRELSNMPSHVRDVNTVFQHYALFPHLTVFENIAYGLRVKGVPSFVIQERVQKMLKMIELNAFANKSIEELSGGQKQRVALARAMINEPSILLLDEPLAALDPLLRGHMLAELVDLHEKTGTTFVYVTHEQAEGLAVSDTVAILNDEGAIEQIGTPHDIYEKPITTFTGQFVGDMNTIPATVKEVIGQHVMVTFEGLGNYGVHLPQRSRWIVPGAQGFFMIRPEKLMLCEEQPTDKQYMQGTIVQILYQGNAVRYGIRIKTGKIINVLVQNTCTSRKIFEKNRVLFITWDVHNGLFVER